MADADLGRAILSVETRDAKFKKDIDRAKKDAKQLDAQFVKTRRGVAAFSDQAAVLGQRLNGVGGQVAALTRGLGALGVALSVGAMVSFTRGAIEAGAALADTADKVGLTVESLQELRFAAQQTGVDTDTLDMAMQRFSRRVGEAAQGTGELFPVLQQYGIAVLDAEGRTRSLDAILGDLANTIQSVEDPQERLRIAFKAFDSEGAALVNTLSNGRRGLDDWRRLARETGAVMSNETAQKARELKREFDALATSIRTQLQEAVINLASVLRRINEIEFPTWLQWLVDLESAAHRVRAEAAKTIAQLLGFDFRSPLQRWTERLAELERQLQSVDQRIASVDKDAFDAAARLNGLMAERRAIVEDILVAQQQIRDIEATVPQVDITGGQPPQPTNVLGETLEDEAERMALEAEMHRQALEDRIQRIREYLMTEAELEQARHLERLEALSLARQQEIITEQEFRDLGAELEAQHVERMREIRERALKDQEQLTRESMASQVQTTAGALSQMTGVFARESKEMFLIHKAAAIGEALMSTYAAINRTWERWGYPWGIPFAAAMGAIGFANVASIASQTFGGAGGGGGGGRGSLAASAPAQPAEPEPERDPLRLAEIRVQGSLFDRRTLEEIAAGLNELAEDGFRFRIMVT